MCGIVGVINRSKTRVNGDKYRKWMAQALYADAFRGKHGTGLIGVTNKNEVATYKKALTSADFLELPQTNKILDNTNNVFLIGHNRWATQGSHTAANTHPFNHGDIHMVHNGTLDFYKGLTPGKSFDVDSEAIAYLLSQEEPKEVLEKLEGAYSLVWYNESYETINFARNKERPMFFGKVAEDKSLLFASEKGMIEWIADRNSIDLEDVYSIKTGVILSIPLDEKEELTIEEFTPKVTNRYSYYESYAQRGGRTATSSTTPSKYKYSHLKDTEIEVHINSWRAYATAASGVVRFGYLIGYYLNDLEINISSIQEPDSSKYINQFCKVKINSIASDGKAYATIVEVLEKKNLPVTIDYSVDQDGPTDSDGIENIQFLCGPNNTKISIKEYEKKTANGCSNCGERIDVVDHEDLLWDENGNCYCSSCTEVLINNVIPFNSSKK